jgi:ribosomal protein S18 acetylase RimI-like enzyme
MDLLGATWGVRAAGLTGLEVLLGSNRRQGLAIYIVAEALRHFQQLGVMLVEAQVEAGNLPAQLLFKKLGFVEVDQAVRYRKETT